ncbi:MAG: amidotransferase [Gammaproteobacteria bacterium]|uniref:amidotransferase n=1 Tax=Rhodoferax sp. TaxID=50421 RepID=UPI0018070801|nr:amidotransferase [Rhodoferax sp.]MBU3898929.1 amidotransferase [Gammaproteobacteria bacterium]MBA3059276.1 amidotransferase [Rhodoferax sp.]MBU3997522.1 amidotransferase [Gammaproteobacteria bacterium]MBU4018372.1 amidotransferase [Gammaproteobacteria bacterium]MBU4080385.1 amidotransferase [Gammaproteobacteria bacterium]
MKLCILENDLFDAELAARFGGFGDMFRRLFAQAGADNWTFEIFNTVQGQYPDSFDDFDAVLLTGSRADSFSQEPWVLSLRQQVQQLLHTKKKLLGVCFGHQLIALCLGAQVGRAPQGWGAGRMHYQWHAPKWAQAPERSDIALLASHQDQVLGLPAGATLLASSAFCPVAAFTVDKQVLCVQPHPEFVEELSAYLLNKRRAVLGEALYGSATDSLALGHEGLEMARLMVAFIEE